MDILRASNNKQNAGHPVVKYRAVDDVSEVFQQVTSVTNVVEKKLEERHDLFMQISIMNS